MKNKYNYYIIACVFLLLIAFASIGVFVLCWNGSHISTIMADWGSFADYISGIPLSIITIIIIIVTYKEQKDSNRTIRFESSFFCLYSSENSRETKVINQTYSKIKSHFDNVNDNLELNRNECVLLLSFYWNLHKEELNYKNLSTTLLYLIKTNLIEEKDKQHYLYILYSNLSDKDYLCFLSYLCNLYYIENRSDFLCNNLLFQFHSLDTFQEQIVNIISNQNVKLQRFDIYEDYGYKEQESEYYKQTLRYLLKQQ
jgi:hypothetical protein